jgi:hypothetical protein
MNDYLNQKRYAKQTIIDSSTLENFEKQEKSENFFNDNRATLVSALKEQYSNIKLRL